MKAYRVLVRSIRDAFKSVVRNFSLSIASIICTTITLILVGIAILFAANVESVTKKIERELTIIVYLKEDTSKEDAVNIYADIKSLDNVTDIISKTKDEWKLEMQEYSETFDAVLSYIDENPLLDSYMVKVDDAKNLKKVSEYIESITGVETVKYGEDMVEGLISTFDVVKKIVLIIVIALIVVTAFLINNTIKLTIFSRHSEISIMRLVGASNIAINLPFIFEGLIIGLIGSIIPICITIYGYVILYSALHGQVFSNMIVLIKPYNFVFQVSLVLALIGGVVGMLSSLKAVKKYLKI